MKPKRSVKQADNCVVCDCFYACTYGMITPTRITRLKIKIVFLGAFAKLRKATISGVMSFRPSVRMEQLGFHWMDFHEI
jgi:hypothetical protein